LKFANGNPNIRKLIGEYKIFIDLVRSLWLHAGFLKRFSSGSFIFGFSAAERAFIGFLLLFLYDNKKHHLQPFEPEEVWLTGVPSHSS